MSWFKSKPKHKHCWHVIGIGPLIDFEGKVNYHKSAIYNKCYECGEYCEKWEPIPPEILAVELEIPKTRIRRI